MPENVETTEPVHDPEDLSDEEIVELVRSFSLSEPIKIPTDKLVDKYGYRWINRAKPNVYQRRRGVGWTPVKRNDLSDLIKKDPETGDPICSPDTLRLGTGTTPDGFVCIGDDLVFARIPKRHLEAIKAEYARRNKEKLTAGKRRFHQAGEMVGAETFEKSF